MRNDSRVRMWEATGGEQMGLALTRSLALDGGAARLGTRVLLELGGNNAAIIHADADLDQAVESTLFGATGTAGRDVLLNLRGIISVSIRHSRSFYFPASTRDYDYWLPHINISLTTTVYSQFNIFFSFLFFGHRFIPRLIIHQ